MGIGLPIVARVVEFHRGGMDLESSEDGGTRFTLEFPLSEREETNLE
jgi:signal transduction histidine kinase